MKITDPIRSDCSWAGPDDLQRDLFALGMGIVEWDRELAARKVDFGGKGGRVLEKLRRQRDRAVAGHQPVAVLVS